MATAAIAHHKLRCLDGLRLGGGLQGGGKDAVMTVTPGDLNRACHPDAQPGTSCAGFPSRSAMLHSGAENTTDAPSVTIAPFPCPRPLRIWHLHCSVCQTTYFSPSLLSLNPKGAFYRALLEHRMAFTGCDWEICVYCISSGQLIWHCLAQKATVK